MKTPSQLGDELKALGVKNVYFQPPGSGQGKLKYPCFIFNIAGVTPRFADNYTYHFTNRYTVTWIGSNPNDGVSMIEAMLKKFKMIRYDRFYTADGLNHHVFDLYW